MLESLQFVLWKNKNSSVACVVRADSSATEAAEQSSLIAVHYVECKGYFTNQIQNAFEWNWFEILNSFYEWRIAAYIID